MTALTLFVKQEKYCFGHIWPKEFHKFFPKLETFAEFAKFSWLLSNSGKSWDFVLFRLSLIKLKGFKCTKTYVGYADTYIYVRADDYVTSLCALPTRACLKIVIYYPKCLSKGSRAKRTYYLIKFYSFWNSFYQTLFFKTFFFRRGA
jgi:hypothetical protein